MSSAALTADSSALPRPAINPWVIALAVTLATFMEVLDTSIANVVPAPHRRQPFRWHRREHMGPDLIPGV